MQVLKNIMNWRRLYGLRSYVRSALWIIPVIAVLVEMPVALFVHILDTRLGWQCLGLGLEGARAVFNAVITITLSFIVFTFGSLLVAIQVASGQYTPRIIATTLLRDNVIRYSVGLFVFTFLFAIKALDRTEVTVPQLVALVTAVLGLLSIAAFLFLIDYAARLLRPVSLVQQVGKRGLVVIDEMYPEHLTRDPAPPATRLDPGRIPATILHKGASGIVLAVNMGALVEAARLARGVVEIVPQVGDFVGTGEPLFLLHGGSDFDEKYMHTCIAFGSERTMEQDPLFALRVLTDIAIKALSAAINDPTTAVLAIDQLQRLLRRAGMRILRDVQVHDPDGALRVVFATPNWENFVHLACCEIRMCGAGNIQIARRMRAMLVNLAGALSAVRHPVLREQLDLLDREVALRFSQPEDIALARIPDSQGMGGSIAAGEVKWRACRKQSFVKTKIKTNQTL